MIFFDKDINALVWSVLLATLWIFIARNVGRFFEASVADLIVNDRVPEALEGTTRDKSARWTVFRELNWHAILEGIEDPKKRGVAALNMLRFVRGYDAVDPLSEESMRYFETLAIPNAFGDPRSLKHIVELVKPERVTTVLWKRLGSYRPVPFHAAMAIAQRINLDANLQEALMQSWAGLHDIDSLRNAGWELSDDVFRELKTVHPHVVARATVTERRELLAAYAKLLLEHKRYADLLELLPTLVLNVADVAEDVLTDLIVAGVLLAKGQPVPTPSGRREDARLTARVFIQHNLVHTLTLKGDSPAT